MPKPKAKKRAVESDEGSSSDSGPEDRTPVKKPSTSTTSSKAKSTEEENSWQLDKTRFIKVNEFKGKVYVNIREFYMDGSGELKPGKKGISLPVSQWNKLKELIPDIDAALKKL
jgi:hypothetical protein